jgi:ADP-L-glycero-D-manno-heptose 6-epimerase
MSSSLGQAEPGRQGGRVIVITGGAGFVGSNLVHALNRMGRSDLLVVDNLVNSDKYENLVGAELSDYLDKDDFLDILQSRPDVLGDVEAVFHQGACTSTTEPDGRYMMRNNYAYSKEVLAFCLGREIPLMYASSAAVYGAGSTFAEEPANEAPLNVYGFSKLLFDVHVRKEMSRARSQVVGLRYFNVYGPREEHKGPMASMVRQLDDQIAETGKARLFGPTEGYAAGEQLRDFVFVDDLVDLNLWFLENPSKSGIFNAGSGRSRSFNDLAREVIRNRGAGEIEYIPFPDSLRGRYQSFTEADLTRLRATGYDRRPTTLEDGISKYLAWRHA